MKHAIVVMETMITSSEELFGDAGGVELLLSPTGGDAGASI